MRSTAHPLLPFPPFATPATKPRTAARSATPERWNRPSLGEFIGRLEEAYGASDGRRKVAVAMGISGSEELSPSGLREFCDQLGVPPEDFGLDP